MRRSPWRSRWRPAMRRSFSSAARTVRRRWPASGCPAGKVRGTRPRRRSPSADVAARSGEPKSTRTKFVTDRPTAQPRARSGRRRGASRSTRTRSRLASRIDGSARASVTTVTETVETEPGGRYGLSLAISSGRGDRETDPQAGQRVGLAGGPDDDEVRVAVTQAQQRPADELGVGLVEDDDRRLAAVARPRRRSARRAGAAMAPSGSARAVGLFGLHSQTTRAVVAAARTVSTSSAQPSDLAQPRDGHDLGAALLGQDAVHGVGRGRDDGAIAGREEGLGDEVEDLVRAGPDQESPPGRRRSARPRRRRAAGSPRAGTRTGSSRSGPRRGSAARARAGRGRCSGRSGRSSRGRRRSARRPRRRSPPSCTCSGRWARRT